MIFSLGQKEQNGTKKNDELTKKNDKDEFHCVQKTKRNKCSESKKQRTKED